MIHKGNNFITSIWKGENFVRSVWKGSTLVYPHRGIQYSNGGYGYNQVGIYYQEQPTSLLEYSRFMTNLPGIGYAFASSITGYTSSPAMWVYDAYVYNKTTSTQTSELRLWNCDVYGVPKAYIASRSVSLASQTGTQLRIFSEPLYDLFTTYPYVTWLWTSTNLQVFNLYTTLNPLS